MTIFCSQGACSRVGEAEGQQIVTVQGDKCNAQVVQKAWRRQGDGQYSWECYYCTFASIYLPTVYSPKEK